MRRGKEQGQKDVGLGRHRIVGYNWFRRSGSCTISHVELSPGHSPGFFRAFCQGIFLSQRPLQIVPLAHRMGCQSGMGEQHEHTIVIRFSFVPLVVVCLLGGVTQTFACPKGYSGSGAFCVPNDNPDVTLNNPERHKPVKKLGVHPSGTYPTAR